MESDEKYRAALLELEEFRLTEKIQSRLFSRLKVIGFAFLGGLSLLGLVGGSLIVKQISNNVSEEIRDDLDSEAQEFKERLKSNLIDLQLSATEISKLSTAAKDQLAEVQTRLDDLKSLEAQYSSLHGEVSRLRDEISRTAATVVAAEQSTLALREAVTKTAQGKPAIFGVSFSWLNRNIESSISGSNLGNKPGSVSLQLLNKVSGDTEIASGDQKLLAGKKLEIDLESIVTWQDSKIILGFSSAMQEKLKIAVAENGAARETLIANYPGINVAERYAYHVVTARGESVDSEGHNANR